MSDADRTDTTARPAPAQPTLGALRASGYRPRTVKDELRANLIEHLQHEHDADAGAGDADAGPGGILPGIVGYEQTVWPQLVHGILSRHDLLLLGLRGQAKTRILRSLVHLLDEWIPIIEGIDLPDDPVHPTTAIGRRLVAEAGDETPIRWIHRRDRYHEKLATPDVTIADLIGEIDIVKHAEGRYLSDEETMHFGLIPRSNRGLFVLNELPDLAPKIQVGLFNILEERDVQIRGYPIRLEIDLMLAFSANPEDYTNRGRIVTPLKDRIGSVVRTHYPLREADARRITRENAFVDRVPADSISAAGHRTATTSAGIRVDVPVVMHQIVEEAIRQARQSSHINQASGVSARASIAALENMVSSAERRGAIAGESRVVPRMCDLLHFPASCRGKIELLLSDEGTDDDGRPVEDRLLESLLGEAVKTVAETRGIRLDAIEHLAEPFERGLSLELSDTTPAADVVAGLGHVEGLLPVARRLAERHFAEELDPDDEQDLACIAELLLETLYVHRRISKAARPTEVVFHR